MKVKHPELVALVAEIAGRDLTEIELLKIEVACIEIEKEELKRNMEICTNP